MTDNNELLKPCPFCGGAPSVDEIEAHTHVIAQMPDCPGYFYIECAPCDMRRFGDTKEHAIAAWNTRHCAQAEDDLTKCPQCGGPADNGVDNCIPQSAYMCKRCVALGFAEKQAEELRARNAMLVDALNCYRSAYGYGTQYAHLPDAREEIANAQEQAHEAIISALSATQQDADAFIAEVRAKAMETFMSAWFDKFMQRVCELPDRNSPDDEPDAVVATIEELRNCLAGTIEDACDDLRASATQPEGKETGK